MYEFAPNIEVLFTEAGGYADRVRAAAAVGFTAVEMWGPTGKDASTHPKDLPSLKAALADTGVRLVAQSAEPRTDFLLPTIDPSPFFSGLREGAEIAAELGCSRLILTSGTGFVGAPRHQQLNQLVDIYRTAVDLIDGSGITLVLEPVNGRIDHPGVFLDRTSDAITIAKAVNSPFFGVLYDVYHSAIEGEDIPSELRSAALYLKYVQIADAPGRGEPGTGTIDWVAFFDTLRDVGYAGPVALEYLPTIESTASATYIRGLLGGAVKG